LNLSYNQISDLAPLKKLTQLTNLDLRNNQIIYLPNEWLTGDVEIKWEQYGGGDGFHLYGNPLEYPPIEIIEQGQEAIRSYVRSLEGERKPLNEVRVLLIGDGGAGKTSLVKRLMGDPFNPKEPQTHGINIRHWGVALPPEDGKKPEALKAHIWDFGGQQIMHATHQFFMSHRSLYLLVLDGRRDEKADYWLKHVESFGGASPVLVVLNKQDENPGHDVDRATLKRKYPNIRGFFELSCMDDEGLQNLKDVVIETMVGLEMRKVPFAQNWFNVKTRLERMEQNYIGLDDYQAMCR